MIIPRTVLNTVPIMRQIYKYFAYSTIILKKNQLLLRYYLINTIMINNNAITLNKINLWWTLEETLFKKGFFL